MYEILKIVKIV